MQRRKHLNFVFGMVSLAGVVLMAVIFILVGKEYIFQPYENQGAGFKIEYPRDWTREENQNGAAVIFYSPLDNKLDYFRDNVNIVVQDLQKPMTLSEYSDLAIKQMEGVFTTNFQVTESVVATLSGRPAHKLVFTGKGPDTELKYYIVWTLDETKAYQVTYLAFPSAYEKYLPKVEKMISSFRLK